MKRRFLNFFIIIMMFILVGCNNKTSKVKEFEISNEIITKSDNRIITDYNNFNVFKMTQDNIKIKINGKLLNLKLPIYLDKNRYYISLNEFIEKLNGSIEKIDDILNINLENKTYCIDLRNNSVTSPNNSFSF